LDKSLFDTQIAYERNAISSLTNTEDIKKQQEKISKDLRDNDLSYSGSTLSLQLQKLASDLEKAELDYQTKLDSDNQTILNFFNSVKLIGSDLSNLFQDSINLSDELL
jgi:arginine repressor